MSSLGFTSSLCWSSCLQTQTPSQCPWPVTASTFVLQNYYWRTSYYCCPWGGLFLCGSPSLWYNNDNTYAIASIVGWQFLVGFLYWRMGFYRGCISPAHEPSHCSWFTLSSCWLMLSSSPLLILVCRMNRTFTASGVPRLLSVSLYLLIKHTTSSKVPFLAVREWYGIKIGFLLFF